MKLLKPAAIVLFLVMGAALLVQRAVAQAPPMAASTPGNEIPEIAPPSWNQQDWNAMRARCLQLSAEVKERQQMTQEQLKSVGPLTSKDLRDAETCLSKIAQPPAPPPSSSLPGQPVPTPVPTAGALPARELSPRSQVEPSSSAMVTAMEPTSVSDLISMTTNLSLASGCATNSNTLGAFLSCPGASQTACVQGEPPDVAGDVSPFFNARPPRDISGIGDQPLFLIAPEINSAGFPFVQVTSVREIGRRSNAGRAAPWCCAGPRPVCSKPSAASAS